MAAGVAHELNSPLTGIVTFSHLMLNRIPPENTQDREDVAVILEQAERCSKIIKGLLGFSRKTTSEKSMVNINTLIDNTLLMMKNQTKFHNIVFDVRHEPVLPDLNVDPNQLQQVFVNLIINAVDAMNKKGSMTIATRTVEEEGAPFVEMEFSDTGPGISEEIRARIFEPFFTTKPTGKGTGLGLAVSYGIVKKHNGRIFEKGEAGGGASFIIRLPVPPKTERAPACPGPF
jgi:two-component system NtrC family sensor kinase